MHALTAEAARAIERRAVAEQGVSLAALMRSAGAAVAAEVSARVPEGDIVVLAGPGNNGGDGWVAAHDLHAAGRSVRVLSTTDSHELAGIAAEAAHGAMVAGVHWRVPEDPLTAEDLADTAVVIDALLGIGATGPLREPLDSWARAVNESGAYVVAVDGPTGIDSDTGAVPGEAVRADCTVTFTAPKRGLVLYPAAEFAGEVVVADIGIDERFVEELSATGATGLGTAFPVEAAAHTVFPEVWLPAEYAALIPRPAADAHKNSRGRVLVVAGSGAYPGAAVLACRGAMRAGAGYVTLATPESVAPIAQRHLLAAPVVGLPETASRAFSSAAAERVLVLACDYDAVVLGPGLTREEETAEFARELIERIEAPLVIDADALGALEGARQTLDARSALAVLTPHAGELGRLLRLSAAEVNADRVSSSAALAAANRVIVLKGAGTVISTEGRQVINTSGTPALATAGTGDVLAGVIGALIATGLEVFSAAALGAYVHGRAGEAAAAELTPVSVTAEDVPEFLPVAWAELLESW